MRFEPLHPDFGVEVHDFDVQAGGSTDEIAALRRAWKRHSMLLFRGGGRIAPERHVEIARWFGPPEPVSNVPGDGCVSVLHNRDMAGSARLPFHSDMTYTDDPVRAICLHAIAVPEGPTATAFVSGIAAWGRVPAELQAELEGMTLRHFLSSDFGYDWPDFIAEHPVCRRHPGTDAPILFVTENHAQRILELDEARSREVLDELFAILYAPAAIYRHEWRQDDLLIWDNLALQHARPEQADPGAGERALQRVALCDTPLPVLVERAREQAAAG
jgi:taurine dioxygenase